MPGVLTMADVRENGSPSITGSPSAIVEHSSRNIDVQKMVNQFKTKANYSYNVNGGVFNGMDWGSPDPRRHPTGRLQLFRSRNIVYFNTNSTYVRMQGGSHGCGTLLVEGDLVVHGGFQWYGVIVVTGSITFTGGGGKNVSGAMLAGGITSADLVGGDATIVYCSQAIHNQTEYLPLITLRWAEIFS